MFLRRKKKKELKETVNKIDNGLQDCISYLRNELKEKLAWDEAKKQGINYFDFRKKYLTFK